MIVCRHSMNCGTHYPDLLNISTERAVGAGNCLRCRRRCSEANTIRGESLNPIEPGLGQLMSLSIMTLLP